MRLIDADALMRDIGVADAVKYGNKTAEQQHNSYSTLMKYEIADYIEDAPTIEAEPVRHGKWERDPTDKNYFICSVCGGFDGLWHEFAQCTHKYCHWCGAKMDLEG